MLIWRRSVWQILESHHFCLTPAMLNRLAAALKGNHHSSISYWEDDEDPVTNLSARQVIPQRTGASSHHASCWAAHAAGWEGPSHQVTLAKGKSLKSSSLDCGSPCSVWMWLVARHFSYEEDTGEAYMLNAGKHELNNPWSIGKTRYWREEPKASWREGPTWLQLWFCCSSAALIVSWLLRPFPLVWDEL